MQRTLFFIAVLLFFQSQVKAMDTQADKAILVDLSTETILLEKAPDASMPPSSMSKLMTVYVAFEQLNEGGITLETPVTASTEVWRRWRLKGSTMFLKAGQSVTVEQLLLGIIVQSGNDACAWLAEAIAGSEDAFIVLMNDAAQRLGMTGSNFTNPNGWPDDNQYMTARDLYILAKALIEQFPEYYDMFERRRFEFGTATSNYNNRNPILGRVRGADGLKTGHTEAAGYGFTGSAERDGRRLILVVNGLASDSARRSESARLLEWGFANFRNYEVLKSGDIVATAPVWMGEATGVSLTLGQDVLLTLSRQDRAKLGGRITYNSPLLPPIEAGQEVASLTLESGDGEEIELPLYAQKDVGKVTGFDKLGAALDHLIFGATPEAE
ncbi:MAG: D-alanyl-D-alanine carboxypeptidase family protein [Pseudomonadota bacterium]